MLLTFLTGGSVWIVIFILVTDEISNYIWFTNVNQETISYNNRSLKFGKGSISFSQISNFVSSIKWIKLNIELPSLMIVTSTSHHRIHWWLLNVFTSVWIIGCIHWNYKIIHLFFHNLLAWSVFNIPTSCPMPIFRALFFIIVILGTIFNPKICISIKLLSPWTILVTLHWYIIVWTLWHNTCRIYQKCKILLQMSWAQNF